MKKSELLVVINNALENDSRVQSFTVERDAITDEIEKISVYFQQSINEQQNVSRRFTVRNSRVTCKSAYADFCDVEIVKADARHSIFYVATCENILDSLFNMFMTELASHNAIEIDNLHAVVKREHKSNKKAE